MPSIGLTAPFLRPSRSGSELWTHLSPQCRKNDLLRLCAVQTNENSPATFSLPRTPNPRNPKFLICPNTGSTIVLHRAYSARLSGFDIRSFMARRNGSLPSLVIVRAAPDFDRQQR